MVRFFCPVCWADFADDLARCPKCDLDIRAFLACKDYGEKLILAVGGPEQLTPLRAKWIVNRLRQPKAAGAFVSLIRKAQDIPVIITAAKVLGEVDTPQAVSFLVELCNHPARMVREEAASILAENGLISSLHVGPDDDEPGIAAVSADRNRKLFSPLELSPAEIHFLWWFMQGSIMNPSTRERLRRAWGMCERHAWGWMTVEAAFRTGHLHGPAILYAELMEQAATVVDAYRFMRRMIVRRRLRNRGRCLMCEEGFGPESVGRVKPGLVNRGRDSTEFQALAQRTFPYWRHAVCGRCAGVESTVMCRKHFLEEMNGASAKEFNAHKAFVNGTFRHVSKYSLSFRWGLQATRTDEDAAALISSIGWLSGWSFLLSILGKSA